jgi:hypothetical protein
VSCFTLCKSYVCSLGLARAKWKKSQPTFAFKWRGLKIEDLNNHLELLTSIFFKRCLVLRTEMDNPPSNFTGGTRQCISIDWYPETSTFMLYATVNASRRPPKSDQLEWYRKWQVIQGNQAFLVSVDRWKALLNLCQIWSCVVHPIHKKNGFEKSETFSPRSVFPNLHAG